jgi:hypothetical protein
MRREMTALYSLVRYVEDLDRGEPVNVGALLWSEGQTFRKFVERDVLGDADVVRRFDELLGYLIEHDDRGDTEPRAASRDEPLIFALARRRFPHFEISEPRQVKPREEPRELLDDLVDQLVQEPARSHRFALFRR